VIVLGVEELGSVQDLRGDLAVAGGTEALGVRGLLGLGRLALSLRGHVDA
jgi:hypothetical protein